MSHSEPTLEQRFLDFRRTGEPALLAAVFDTTSPELLAIARRAVNDPLDAEDVVQATFLTALQKAARFRQGEALMPWLVGILRNHVHKQRSRRAVDTARLLDQEPSAPDDAAAAGELMREVRTAIANLPQPYRTTLSLKLLHGLSAAQIAEATGETTANVRVRVHRGLSMLRNVLPQGLAGVLAATDKQAIHAYVRDGAGTIVTMLSCTDGACRTCLAAGDYTVDAFGIGTFGHGGKSVSGSVRITAGQDQSLRIILP